MRPRVKASASGSADPAPPPCRFRPAFSAVERIHGRVACSHCAAVLHDGAKSRPFFAGCPSPKKGDVRAVPISATPYGCPADRRRLEAQVLRHVRAGVSELPSPLWVKFMGRLPVIRWLKNSMFTKTDRSFYKCKISQESRETRIEGLSGIVSHVSG
jgi:hypothetical protein